MGRWRVCLTGMLADEELKMGSHRRNCVPEDQQMQNNSSSGDTPWLIGAAQKGARRHNESTQTDFIAISDLAQDSRNYARACCVIYVAFPSSPPPRFVVESFLRRCTSQPV